MVKRQNPGTEQPQNELVQGVSNGGLSFAVSHYGNTHEPSITALARQKFDKHRPQHANDDIGTKYRLHGLTVQQFRTIVSAKIQAAYQGSLHRKPGNRA